MGYDFVSREECRAQIVNSISYVIKKQVDVRIVDGNERKEDNDRPDISKIFSGLKSAAMGITEYVE